jgi:hypothetical protein
MQLPPTPFTMTQFLELNSMPNAAHDTRVTKRIRTRLLELGFRPARRKMEGKLHPVPVWVESQGEIDFDDLDTKLRELTK